ncbi:mandelate racemase/muconate lactonizing enzyme family protein [Leucobacter sp. M11]|uniref:mandelate racemase/muconate lactonizing enzyme family protein n=1 Tax=Leucobacter sp. M11 TaxID=2993565 RepID=UPI002D80F3B8|nr:mandelate racemase/muconate lactonizing enzyme family protein [Leucobacter sp. M11]MEB4614538.1 mandelate racemase/muconate lactonizing enzyme family protein [Leucobacter sp. M11]
MTAERPSVAAVRTANAVLSLPEPLRLGAMTVTRREYAGVRVDTAAGLSGMAYCLSREAPMTEIVDRLVAPHVIGADSSDPPAAWERMFRGSAIVGRVGLVRRAIGLVDIALWDLAGQHAGVPVWDLLGAGNAPRETMLVASYPTPDRPIADVVAEVVGQASEGWPLVKISRAADPAYMGELIRSLNRELPSGCGLVVDVGFGWRDADEALADIRAWGEIDLAWLEDPLLPEDVAGCARIRRETGLTVSVGDEVTDPAVLRALVQGEAVDVLRLDVVAVGGLTPARELRDWCAERGVPVSCHVYPELSVHLGTAVETFNRRPEGNPYDPSPLLSLGGPAFVAGRALPPTAPGLGFALRPEFFAFPE